MSAPRQIKIDFVSDVVCPWCAIGLTALEQAVARIGDGLRVEWHFQPFELNPQMAPEGEDIIEHLSRKYGSTPEQIRATQEAIRARGEALGFTFNMGLRQRTYNTFDAHRLLHWAEEQGPEQQAALKRALLKANFTDQRNPSDHAVLADIAAEAGLDRERAAAVLASGEFGAEVRQREAFYQQSGIQAVPAVIIADKYLISGGQPAEVFEQALRHVAAELDAQTAVVANEP